jgi:hypothetical protein
LNVQTQQVLASQARWFEEWNGTLELLDQSVDRISLAQSLHEMHAGTHFFTTKDDSDVYPIDLRVSSCLLVS